MGSFGYTALNGFGMLRGVPLSQMATAMPYAFTRWLVRNLGKVLVPKIQYKPLFLQELNQKYVEAMKGTKCQVIYVGGADSFKTIEQVLATGNCAVQLGRALIREPFFVKKIANATKEAQSSEEITAKSTCIHCNQCTLTSIDPVKFKAGCPYLKPKCGEGIEDVEDIAKFVAQALQPSTNGNGSKRSAAKRPVKHAEAVSHASGGGVMDFYTHNGAIFTVVVMMFFLSLLMLTLRIVSKFIGA